LGKKIKDKERSEAFNRLRVEIFGKLGLPVSSGENIINDFRYDKVADELGIRKNESGETVYPDSWFGYDYSSEEGIRKATEAMAQRYSDISKSDTAYPGAIREHLWKAFEPKYNPAYEEFANSELAKLKDPNGSSITITYKNLQDILIHDTSGNETAAREAAKGTLLEDMVGNPVNFASNLKGTIDYRYIQKFGYTLDQGNADYADQDIFHAWQINIDPKSKFKEPDKSLGDRIAENRKNKEKTKSSINSNTAELGGTETKSGGPQLNSTGPTEKPTSQPASGSPINEAPIIPTESTSTTNSEVGLTSKSGELTKEAVLPKTEESPAININLENKAPDVTQSSPNLNTNISNASTSINSAPTSNITSTLSTQPSESLIESTSQSNSVNTTNSVNTEAATSTSNSTVLNSMNKEKPKGGGFLSKLGKVASFAGSALNLPSFSEIGKTASELYGSTIGSKISDIKESISNSSINSNASSNSVSNNASLNTNSLTNPELSSNSSNVSNQSSVTVEQNKPAVSILNESTNSTQTDNTNAISSPTVSNTTNSQSASTIAPVSSPTSAQSPQPASVGTPGEAGGTYVDINRLVQSINKLERILISGIEVTIKDV
jgi:hypothetical protein